MRRELQTSSGSVVAGFSLVDETEEVREVSVLSYFAAAAAVCAAAAAVVPVPVRIYFACPVYVPASFLCGIFVS